MKRVFYFLLPSIQRDTKWEIGKDKKATNRAVIALWHRFVFHFLMNRGQERGNRMEVERRRRQDAAEENKMATEARRKRRSEEERQQRPTKFLIGKTCPTQLIRSPKQTPNKTSQIVRFDPRAIDGTLVELQVTESFFSCQSVHSLLQVAYKLRCGVCAICEAGGTKLTSGRSFGEILQSRQNAG